MRCHRRKFLNRLAGGLVGSSGVSHVLPPLKIDDRNGAQVGTRRTDASSGSSRTLDVVVCFDCEDSFSPPELGNDDSIKELATILSEEQLRGTFLFIGDKAELLRDRGRQDVIDSLAPHEVGLHTRSARHPTVPEYVAKMSWEDAVAETLKHESEGVKIIERVFEKPCAAISGHYEYDSPHLQRVAAILDRPNVYVYPAAPPLFSISWYAGALGLPFQDVPSWLATGLGLSCEVRSDRPFRAYFGGFDDRYPNNREFEAHLRRLDEHINACLAEGQPFLTLFLYHPQRLRLMDFVDGYSFANGVNIPRERWGIMGNPPRRPPDQTKTALINFRRLARWLRFDPRLNLMTVTEVKRRYGQQPDQIERKELFEAARLISAANEILMHPRFSPAEITTALGRALISFADQGQIPSSVRRENVLGPTRSPIWQPEMQGCSLQKLTQLARQMVDHVTTTGHLPATLGLPLERVGVNHLYRAFAENFLAISTGSTLREIGFRRARPWPAIGSLIGIRFVKEAEGHLMIPDLDVNTLYRDGKLQTWTLKPALIS